MSPSLSVLDLSPIPSGSTAGDALRNSLDLARHAEALGLRRYWLAEHHNAGGLACPAPEILIGQIAAQTTSLRVGSGGIMLPNHTPLKVAETFRVLHALFPGRIDLGLGRAPGTDPRTAAALRRSREAVSADDFPEQLAELARYLDEQGPPRPAFSPTIRAIPVNVPSPELWLLGSGDSGGAVIATGRASCPRHAGASRGRSSGWPSSARRATRPPRGSRPPASSRWCGFFRGS